MHPSDCIWDPTERKRLVRICVDQMKPTPERLEVEITYGVPEFVVNSLAAGARYEVQQRNLGREAEVVWLTLTSRGSALVPNLWKSPY